MASTNSALRRIGANRTLGAMVDFSADYEAPGLLVRGREGGLYVGELDAQMTARVEVARELMSYSTPTRATCNVMGYVWSKLCKGTMDATTALVDADIGEVRAIGRRNKFSSRSSAKDSWSPPQKASTRSDSTPSFRRHSWTRVKKAWR